MNSGEKVKFELTAKQIKYKDILNKEFIELEIYAISDIDPNRNKSHFTLGSMKKSLDGFKNKPIVGFFENGDFTDHAGKMGYDVELKKAFWDTEKGERVLGVIRESDPVEIVEKDGLNWIKVRCVLFVQYCYKQIKRLLKDKSKKVSVEITVHDSEIRDDKIEDILDFSLNGITILGSKNGKNVMEAIPNANATILEQLDEDVIEEQKKMLSFAYHLMDGEFNDKNINEERKEDKGKLEHRELEEKIWKALSEVKIECNEGYNCSKYYISKIFDDHIIVIEHETDERYKLLYEIDDDRNVRIIWESLKDMKDIDEMVREAEEKYSVKEEDIASGADIKVDKSKEAMSDREWGSVDKGYLRETVIKAGNFKEIAGDIFLDLREGWENGEVSKLKYPVMVIEGDTAVYNRGALASAKAYAEKNEEDEIISKLNKIYEDLDIIEKKENESSENVSEELAKEGEDKLGIGDSGTLDNAQQQFEDNCGCEDHNNDAGNADNGEGVVDDDKKDKDEDNGKEDKEDYKKLCDEYACKIKENDEKFAELESKCAQLTADCDNYKSEIESLNAKLLEYTEKYADYDSIKDRMEKAEATVWAHFCDNMKQLAIAKLDCEDVANEDRDTIIMKASKGEYATEEDLDKEIAYAAYKNRQGKTKTTWNHFQMNIVNSNDTEENINKPLTRQERLAQTAHKGKK